MGRQWDLALRPSLLQRLHHVHRVLHRLLRHLLGPCVLREREEEVSGEPDRDEHLHLVTLPHDGIDRGLP
jgi:hypothetical protein